MDPEVSLRAHARSMGINESTLRTREAKWLGRCVRRCGRDAEDERTTCRICRETVNRLAREWREKQTNAPEVSF